MSGFFFFFIKKKIYIERLLPLKHNDVVAKSTGVLKNSYVFLSLVAYREAKSRDKRTETWKGQNELSIGKRKFLPPGRLEGYGPFFLSLVFILWCSIVHQST